MKKTILIFMIIASLVLTACGNTGASNNGVKPAERVLVYEIDDILGCWYGSEANGEKWLIRVFEDSDSTGVRYRFTMNAYDGTEEENLYGDVLINTDTWEDGETSTSCTMLASLVGGEFDEMGKLCACVLYDNESFTLTPFDFDESVGGHTPNEDRKITFTRKFFAPVLKVERTSGSVSGVWYGRDGEDTTFVEMYADGSFSIRAEGEAGSGVYSLDGDVVTLTIKTIDGEEYTRDDATVSVTLTKDNDLLYENGSALYAVQGGENIKYETLDKTYTLELCDNGTFYMNKGDNQVAGVYMKDASGYTMYALCGGGYVESETCIGEIEGEDTLSFYFASEGDDNRILFNKVK